MWKTTTLVHGWNYKGWSLSPQTTWVSAVGAVKGANDPKRGPSLVQTV